MDTKKLIQNLIEAIEVVAEGPTPLAIEDARETASLARLVLPTLDAAPPAPVTGGDFFFVEDNIGAVVGPYATETAATQALDAVEAAGGGGEVFVRQTEANVMSHYGGAVPQGPGPQPAPPPASAPLPAHAPACSQCGATLDANGDCPDPNCPSNAPAQSYDEMLDDLKAGMPARPGSVIANKPAGSLYKK